MSGSRNILQRVGAAPDLNSKEDSDSEEETDRRSPSGSSNMNMKQEGPFLMPQLWKDNINLDNLTNDFLESNVTGEVMNLDDFLKELQVNELAQQTEELQRHMMSPPGSQHPSQHLQRMSGGSHQQVQGDNRFPGHGIRPASINSLKDSSPTPPSRPSIMHQVGKAPDLNRYGGGQHEQGGQGGEGLNLPNVSLPYRGVEQAVQQQQNHLFHSQHNKESVSNLDQKLQLILLNSSKIWNLNPYFTYQTWSSKYQWIDNVFPCQQLSW